MVACLFCYKNNSKHLRYASSNQLERTKSLVNLSIFDGKFLIVFTPVESDLICSSSTNKEANYIG